MTRLRRRGGYSTTHRSASALAKAGGAVRASDSVLQRKQALQAGAAVPEGRAVCEVCSRVVRVRKDGGLFAHNHCPGATPTGFSLNYRDTHTTTTKGTS